MSKTILITGPARGIGAETARRLAARGNRLALVGMEPEKLAALAKELGDGHFWAEADVTNQEALERAVAGAVAALGGLDVVIANAGIASHGTVAVTPARDLARVIEVNLIGIIRTVSATMQHVVARKGYFLLVSSAAAIVATPGMAAYAASKSGVEHFSNALRLEVAHRGVMVGTAHPCWIDTDMVRDTQNDLESFRRLLRKLPGPFGTVTTVEKCAEALVEAVEKRQRKVFIPKSLRPYAFLRQLIMSPFGEYFMARDLGKMVPRLENEVAALGRSFGEHSVENR